MRTKESDIRRILELELIVQNLTKENRFKEKIEYCLEGLELDPNNTYFLSSLGFYYYKTEFDYERAYFYFRKCIENGDVLAALKKAYFHCVIQTNRVPDKLDIKLLKGQFDRNGNFCDYHLVLINRIFDEYKTDIDSDIIMFYILDKLRSKKFENIEMQCDKFLKVLPNNTKGLKTLEYIILLMKSIKDFDRYVEYAEVYKNMVYEFPDRITQNRLENINSYYKYIDREIKNKSKKIYKQKRPLD